MRDIHAWFGLVKFWIAPPPPFLPLLEWVRRRRVPYVDSMTVSLRRVDNCGAVAQAPFDLPFRSRRDVMSAARPLRLSWLVAAAHTHIVNVVNLR